MKLLPAEYLNSKSGEVKKQEERIESGSICNLIYHRHKFTSAIISVGLEGFNIIRERCSTDR